ncbi:hypothetical protein [Aliiroseovarius halocynthiae]|uniref:Uncharacterized protein n=1 Tax=Aliiroseovarius halocynthiae TaxID=985055 RepID=A0A545SW84_9RHOB|nr:hypothetical protein [Aliiroseovarius halocynthiae]TQV69219.1 hypothetical protein FIL88_06580 [Aliiroseovarius halocynthiae]
MAKFVSLSFWITLTVYLALASPLAVGWIETWLAANVPVLGSPVANLLTSRFVAGVIWGSIALFIVAPGWRLLWKLPLAGPWLANRYFPDLNGDWVVTIQSNWPIVEHLKTAATSKEITFDPFTNDLPNLLDASFDVKIKQSWFRTDVVFLPNDKTPLLSSETISVEFFKSDSGKKSIAWIYEQTNKQDNTRRLAVTDQPKFHGSAVLIVSEDATELQGQYWQNRSWNHGLNAAGLITMKRTNK